MTIKEFRCESCGKTFLGQANSRFCYDCLSKRTRGLAKDILRQEDIEDFIRWKTK